jgi:ATP-dependent DNA helicase RecQ
VDVTQAAQKALSAVHRLGGRFGRGRVVDHLLGKSKDVSSGETQMSTYGIGKEFSAVGWRDLLDQLMFEGLLHEDPNDGRPLIGLGEAEGVGAVYRGERRVAMRKTPAVADSDASGRKARKRRVGGDSQEVDAANMALFEALRAWRRDRAAEQHVPPYVIFHDATLADIARLRPKTKDELKGVSGVGQSKLQRYGTAVLDVVRKH